MPTVLRFRGYRIMIYPDDHRPPHVHVHRAGCEVVFLLNCPKGPLSLRETEGFSFRELNQMQKNLSRSSINFAKHGRLYMVTATEFRQATARMAEMKKKHPYIVKAKYDAKLRRVILMLSSNAWFSFSPSDAQGLESATTAQLKEMEISPSGFGIHFPQVDADLYLPAMMQGHFGSRKWMAARLGAAGGSVRSKSKASAARANGKLGGRPRKTASA